MTPTLREINGLDRTPATLAEATLVLIDYQNTYTHGVLELSGWDSALEAAADLLRRARAAGTTVIHVVHDDGPGSLYDFSADIGQIHPKVAPIAGESVVVKHAPGAFIGTDLGEKVDAAGNSDLVLAGFMTHMCVTFTAEGAFLRGNTPTVVADACATRPLRSPVAAVTAEELHRAALAQIGDIYGIVVTSVADLK